MASIDARFDGKRGKSRHANKNMLSQPQIENLSWIFIKMSLKKNPKNFLITYPFKRESLAVALFLLNFSGFLINENK